MWSPQLGVQAGAKGLRWSEAEPKCYPAIPHVTAIWNPMPPNRRPACEQVGQNITGVFADAFGLQQAPRRHPSYIQQTLPRPARQWHPPYPHPVQAL
jgi:hypothetical protein